MSNCPFHGATPPTLQMSDFTGSDAHGPESMSDPFPVYKKWRETAPVVAIQYRGLTYYHVTGWDAAVAALKDPRFSKDRSRMADAVAPSGKTGAQAGFVITGGAAKGNLLNTDAPEHTRLRNLVAQAFSPRQIAAQECVIEELVEERLAWLSERETADIVADYAYPIAITMICRILGVPSKDQDKFRIWATAASTPHVVAGAEVSQEEGRQLMQEYLSRHIAEVRRRVEAGEQADDADVLSAMAGAQIEKDALSDEELQSMAFLLLIAGHETTVGLISATLLRLARQPDQKQLLLENEGLMSSAVEEFLRIDGSVQRTTFRVATEDVEIAGFRIPKGGLTVVALPTANRDPSRFEDPDRLDITRKAKPNLAFGFGAHFCLGSNLAKLETRLAVGKFLQRFPNYEVGEPQWAQTVIRAPYSLPVTLGTKAPQ